MFIEDLLILAYTEGNTSIFIVLQGVQDTAHIFFIYLEHFI